MNQGKLVFAQLMQHLPLTTFRRCVGRYDGEHKVQTFSCLDQFLCMAFAQLTYRESLRDIEACLRAQRGQALPHGHSRHGRAQHAWPTPTSARLAHLRRLRPEPDRHRPAPVRRRAASGVDLHDDRLRAGLHHHRPVPVAVSRGPRFARPRRPSSCTRCSICAATSPVSFTSPTASCTMSTSSTSLLPSRAPSTSWIAATSTSSGCYRIAPGRQLLRHARQVELRCQRRYSRPVDHSTGLLCDQTVVLTGSTRTKDYPEPLRRIRFNDAQTDKRSCSSPTTSPAGAHHRRALPLPLAGRTVLQVDQAASAHQGVLRHLGERGEDADLDRRLRLRARRHHSQAPATVRQPLRNSTDPEPHHVRANPAGSATCAIRSDRKGQTNSLPSSINVGTLLGQTRILQFPRMRV